MIVGQIVRVSLILSRVTLPIHGGASGRVRLRAARESSLLDSSLVDSVLSDPFEYDYRFTKVVQATAVACTLQVLPIQMY